MKRSVVKAAFIGLYVITCLAHNILLPLVVPVWSLAVLSYPPVVLVYPLVALVCPLVALVYPLVVSVCPLVVPVVLYVGLFITDLLVLLNQKKVIQLSYHVQASFINKKDKCLCH